MDYKQKLYHKAIDLLNYIEMAVDNEKHYKAIRKKVLDLANDIMRTDDVDNG